MMGTQSADAGPEPNHTRDQTRRSNLAFQQVITGSATDAALLAVVDALAEIARETGAAQVNEQPPGVVKDDH